MAKAPKTFRRIANCPKTGVKATFAGLLLLCTLACNIPLGEIFSRYGSVGADFDEKQVVGVWLPNEATLRFIREEGKYGPNIHPRMQFMDDYTFRLDGMPDWWLDGFGRSSQGAHLYTGKWKISKEESCIDLQMSDLSTRIGIREHKLGGSPKYVIEVFIGDPDSGNSMIFLKQDR
ncbi:MAG: hypothetical protein ACJ73D_11310 [Pyrinomonadaceae bacterium]